MNNILILGDGAREQTIAEKLKKENTHIFFYSKNDFNEIKNLCEKENINLVIPSSETYLCNGIKDYLQTLIPNIKIFGPDKYQSKIEGSKHFSKLVMRKLKIPTADFIYFKDKHSIVKYIYEFYKHLQNDGIVIKYSGLAKGKGVYLPNNCTEAISSINELYDNNKESYEGILVEKKLIGTEVSVLAFCNGIESFLMPQSQDYKRIYDNDNGPNTGGMGAICPVNILNTKELQKVKEYMDRIVRTLNYTGVLYAGIIKNNNNIHFLEFNCRFGDPETQVILNLLDTDLETIIINMINKRKLNIEWNNSFAAAVVLSHKNYPYTKLNEPVKIIQTNKLDDVVKIYKSNITNKNNEQYTTGGRVLSMVSVDNSIQKSLENIYNNTHKITYPGVYYRRDIGSNYKNNNKNYKKLSIGVLASGKATSIDNVLYDSYTSDCIKVFISDEISYPLLQKANEKRIPYINMGYIKHNSKTYYEKMVDLLHYFNVDIVILSGYMRIIPDILYDSFYTINIHPSLLPKYKGMTGDKIHKLIIENDDKFIGCTLHEVTKDVDGGRILLQRQAILDKEYDITQQNNTYHIKNQIQTLEKQCIYNYIINYDNNKTKYDINIQEGNNFVNDLKTTGLIKDDFCASFNHKGINFGASADGCGTKLDMANIYNSLEQIGIDLVAMNVNDLLAGGCKPLFFMDYIAIDKMDRNKCNKIIKGIIDGCNICDCKLIGGETAEMKGIYLKNKLDLAGFAIGEQMYDLPKKQLMETNCYLYGLKSSGIHSNGYTLVKKLWENSNTYKPDIKDILTPTRIYHELLDLYEKYEHNILGVAHITGGGFHDNITRILPGHLYFELYDWDFPNIFTWIQNESNLSKEEMLGIFNCGYGMVVITNKEIDIGDKIGKIISA